MMIDIQEIPPLPDALVQSALPNIDYRDALTATIATGHFPTVVDFARAYFLAQPASKESARG